MAPTILLIARSAAPAHLRARLDALVAAGADAYIVVDDGDTRAHPRAISVPNDELTARGITHLAVHELKRPMSAWERAVAYAALYVDAPHVWLMEDDVHLTDVDAFVALLAIQAPDPDLLCCAGVRTQAEDPAWPHWWQRRELGLPADTPLHAAFLPLCRLSRAGLDALVAHGAAHRRLAFFELLFPTLLTAQGLCVASLPEPDARRIALRFRPEFDDASMRAQASVLAFHPVKRASAVGAPS
jgi:hypothetical protein